MPQQQLSTIVYFGEKWDSPYLDEEPGRLVVYDRTPVGESCFWCDEVIVEGDRGLFRPVVRGEPGKETATSEPIHTECDLRNRLGSPAHLTKQCRCAGKDEPTWPGTKREEALASLAIINDQRAEQGLGPL